MIIFNEIQFYRSIIKFLKIAQKVIFKTENEYYFAYLHIFDLMSYIFITYCLLKYTIQYYSKLSINYVIAIVKNIKQQALNIQSKEIIDILSFNLNTIITKMAKLSLVNLWSSSFELKINQEIMHCQNSQQTNEKIQRNLVCYSNSDYFKSRKIDQIQFFKLMKLLQINQYTFDFVTVSHEVYLVSFLDNQLTGYYPTKLKNETLEIVQQEWFLNYTLQLQQGKQLIPYKLTPLIRMDNYDQILSAFSIVLFDSKQIVGGVGSLIINFRNIQQFFYVSNLSIILVLKMKQVYTLKAISIIVLPKVSSIIMMNKKLDSITQIGMIQNILSKFCQANLQIQQLTQMLHVDQSFTVAKNSLNFINSKQYYIRE